MRRFKLVIVIVVFLAAAAALLLAFDPRWVRGVVSDELNGGPVAGAAIRIGERCVYADAAGEYTLGWLYGNPKVAVWMDGYLSCEGEVPKDRFPLGTIALDVRLVPNQLSGLVLDEETGAPLLGAVVSAGDLYAATDASGRYTLRRVRGGSLMNASVAGYEGAGVVFNGQKTQELRLKPRETRMRIVDLYSLEPVPDVTVTYGAQQALTDDQGTLLMKRLVPGNPIGVRAAGYAAAEAMYDGSDEIAVRLRPNTVQGLVHDRRTGEPLDGAAVTVVSDGAVLGHSVTGPDGRYSFRDLPESIVLRVAAEAYERFEAEVGPVTELDVDVEPFQVKGVYMPFGLLTSERLVRELLDLVQRTDLNTIVVDVKSDRGRLAFQSAVEAAQRSGAYHPRVMDLGEFLSLCQERGIYTIARLVLFKDSSLATAYPEWAVHTDDGEIYRDLEGSLWVDPFLEEVQDYNIAIAKEVAELGFDELQFDYLRFPSDGSIHKVRYVEESTLQSRTSTMDSFCARLRRELDPYAVLLSADVFGLTVWVTPEDDMGIGQRVIDIAPHMDYISPMLYPSTFASGSLDYEDPMQYPYEVVYRSCVELSKKTQTKMRPWLQHYSWNHVDYGVDEMRLQKAAAADAGTYGWMFWNAAGKYQEGTFDPAPQT